MARLPGLLFAVVCKCEDSPLLGCGVVAWVRSCSGNSQLPTSILWPLCELDAAWYLLMCGALRAQKVMAGHDGVAMGLGTWAAACALAHPLGVFPGTQTHHPHLPHSQAPALEAVSLGLEAVGLSSCLPHKLRSCKGRLSCADLLSRLRDAGQHFDEYTKMRRLRPLPSQFERDIQLQRKQGGWRNSKVAACVASSHRDCCLCLLL